MHRLQSQIEAANAAGRIALIPFLTAGFPDKQRFLPILHELDDSGVDIIEVGVPFSDPVADGPVVEAASRRSLESGTSLAGILADLSSERLATPIVLMGYYNPFLQYGLENLARDAAKANVAGIIVPDLPYEESGPLHKLLREKDIALIPLVGPNTSKERMRLYAKDSMGYVYVVSVLGITGERKSVAGSVASLIDRTREVFSIPVALGFGLSRLEQLEILPPGSWPNAAVFGSALLTHLDAGKSAKEFIQRWHEAG